MMKKRYIKPAFLTDEFEISSCLLAGSGPLGSDASKPGITDDGSDGPGADGFGNQPGYGVRLCNNNVWDDYDDE